MTRRSVVFLITALAGLIALTLSLSDRNSPNDGSLIGTESSTLTAPVDPSTTKSDGKSAGIKGATANKPLPTPQPAPNTSAAQAPLPSLIERIVLEPDLALTQTTLAETWSVDDYLSATTNPAAVDGATAFAAYEFARSCIGEPRSDDQFEFRLEQYNQYMQDNPRRISPERLDRAMDELQGDFLRCEPFSETDLVDTASSWLMLSADLGYLPAQVRFYQELPALLRETQSRVFREPHYLDLHQSKSVEYMNLAIQTGHPRSFLAMAIALTDGVVFNEDLIAAHAYYVAANLAAAGRDPQIGEMLARSEADRSPGDLRLAENWGRNLCWDYCRLGEPESMTEFADQP